MKRAIDLAGFFAAHAVWCVSDNGPLVPLVAYELPDGHRGCDRFADTDLQRAVEHAKEQLQANAHSADSAVLIYDGYVTLGTWRTDALFLDIRSFSNPIGSLSMAVPYRSHEDAAGFAVFRPKFLGFTGADTPNYSDWGELFFAGADKHTEGIKVWNAHLDQSR